MSATPWDIVPVLDKDGGEQIGSVSTRQISESTFEWVILLKGKPVVSGTGSREEMNAAILSAI